MSSVGETLATRSRDVPSGCREWTRGKDWDGYGIIRIEGTSYRAHRVAWSIVNGPIPPGLVVMHLCDNPSCIIIDHLACGTVAENNRDRQLKGRSSDRRGDKCPTAKLSWPQVRSIRAALADGETQTALMQQYGIARKTIYKIAHAKAWVE